MAKMGRPTMELDQTLFEDLCGIQCTLSEIASCLHCSEDTVERWCKRTYGVTYAEAHKKHCGSGKISLRRAQFRLAEKNAAMAIWLGKQYLGQRDPGPGEVRPDTPTEGTDMSQLTDEELRKLAKLGEKHGL